MELRVNSRIAIPLPLSRLMIAMSLCRRNPFNSRTTVVIHTPFIFKPQESGDKKKKQVSWYSSYWKE